MGFSTKRFLKTMGIKGPKLRKVMRELAEEADKGSFWLWLWGEDKAWGRQES